MLGRLSLVLLALLQSATTATGLPTLTLPRAARVMVVAPHPDDETLGAGGVINRLTRQHIPTRVVFVTNGDGWPWAVQEDFALKKPTDADYVALGELRQHEAWAATRRLG